MPLCRKMPKTRGRSLSAYGRRGWIVLERIEAVKRGENQTKIRVYAHKVCTLSLCP